MLMLMFDSGGGGAAERVVQNRKRNAKIGHFCPACLRGLRARSLPPVVLFLKPPFQTSQGDPPEISPLLWIVSASRCVRLDLPGERMHLIYPASKEQDCGSVLPN